MAQDVSHHGEAKRDLPMLAGAWKNSSITCVRVG